MAHPSPLFFCERQPQANLPTVFRHIIHRALPLVSLQHHACPIRSTAFSLRCENQTHNRMPTVRHEPSAKPPLPPTKDGAKQGHVRLSTNHQTARKSSPKGEFRTQPSLVETRIPEETLQKQAPQRGRDLFIHKICVIFAPRSTSKKTR